MYNVNVPTGYRGLAELPKQRESLINMFSVEGGLIRSPGIEAVNELILPGGIVTGCRGAGTWFVDDLAYFVIDTVLYRLNADESLSNLGTIDGNQRVVIVGGQVELLIMAVGGKAYTYSDGPGLEQIIDPNFLPSKAVDFIDGRFVFVPSDGSPAFYTEVDDAKTILPTSFFDAEELPDINENVVNIRNLLFIQGSQSTEVFSSTGDPDAPFSRRNSRIDYGFVSAGVRYKDTYVFIGKQRGQSYGIYVLNTGGLQDLSKGVVAQDINKRYTSEQVQACVAERFTWIGYECIAFTFHDRTYVFCEGNWFFMDSELNGTNEGPWRARGVCFARGKFYCGDRTTGRIGKLTDAPSEYGELIEYQLETYFRGPHGSFLRPKMLELDVLTGQGTKAVTVTLPDGSEYVVVPSYSSTVGLSLSRDGRGFSDYHYRNLGNKGDYQKRVRWRPSGGLGRFESFMGIKIRGTGKVQIGMEGLNVS